MKIETERGERTLWGIDLERAVKESLTRPQIGAAVGLRAIRKDSVTVICALRFSGKKLCAMSFLMELMRSMLACTGRGGRGLLLTTEVMVADAPKDERHARDGMPGGGGMGDGYVG